MKIVYRCNFLTINFYENFQEYFFVQNQILIIKKWKIFKNFFSRWPPAAILNYGKCSTFWEGYPILSFSIGSKLYKSIIKNTFLDVDTLRRKIPFYTPTIKRQCNDFSIFWTNMHTLLSISKNLSIVFH